MSQILGKLDLNLLRVLDAIYTTRNISRAAASIGVSQPAMSNALSRLRDTLGDPLFIRKARGVTPTARAEELMPTVRRILSDADSIIAPKEVFDPQTSQRQFRICMVDAFEPLVMPSLIDATNDCSGVQFQMLLSAETAVDDALQTGAVDLVVNLPLPMHRDLKWEILAPLDLVLIARKDHPVIQGSITQEQMFSLPHVALDMAPGRMANTKLLRTTRKLELKSTVLVNRVGAIAEVVAATELIGIIPRLNAQFSPVSSQLQIVPLPWSANDQNYAMTWHKRTDNDSGLIWLRNIMRNAIHQAQIPAAFAPATATKGCAAR